MPLHLGLQLMEKSGGLKLTRENYIRASNKSSFGTREIYPESYIKLHTKDCLENFDLNMEYYHLLSKQEFNEELTRFLDKTKVFNEFIDLSLLKGSPGYYVMVLDEYSQVYIGISGDITRRIRVHWSAQKQFDRLIFGGIDDSILSIDSFRAYDTTRIFAYVTNDFQSFENEYINYFDPEYMLNRTVGGTLSGLTEAILHRKTRKLR
ncbi:hypothetical protein FQV26_09845 [Planococcus sp. CPCC 101016]|uniref:hypothetical protein n=1 Tax=Planococcus sp. CPCC 101016 TaxID=2599617 RepID=UPI0011B843D5|nr:hypothetical protein [Planococcus sp. CPCC 101016]TWT08090.1 hypothetical protein FQV26_09845 [Planococcus sp. CPCC 101016]